MIELKVFVVFLTLTGINIPSTGVEGPYTFPLEFAAMKDCRDFVTAHIENWIKNEIKQHGTDELEVEAICTTHTDPA